MSIVGYAEKLDDFRAKVKALSRCHFPLWETERVAEFCAWAVEKLSPFQVGDVAEPCLTPDIKPDSGWYCHRHMLVAGKRGTVREVSWADGKFSYLWEPDAQTWISSQDGIERPIVSPYHYSMPAAWLQVPPKPSEET